MMISGARSFTPSSSWKDIGGAPKRALISKINMEVDSGVQE
jgi:hypothetical protein